MMNPIPISDKQWWFHINIMEMLPDPNRYYSDEIIIKFGNKRYCFTKVYGVRMGESYIWVQHQHRSSFATMNPIIHHNPLHFIKE